MLYYPGAGEAALAHAQRQKGCAMKNISKGACRALCLALAFLLTFSCVPALSEGGIPQWINTDVEDAVGVLTLSRLKDDFHLAVNRKWLQYEQIPWGSSEASSFMDQSYEVMERKIALIGDKTLKGHDADLMRKLCGLALDWDTRNALGVEPLRPYVEEMEAIRTLQDLTDYMTSLEKNAFQLDPSAYTVQPDTAHPDRYIASLAPVPLILGDSAEYTGERTAYGNLVYGIAEKSTLYMLGRLGYTQEEAQAVFDGAIAFDAMAAPYIRPNSDQYTADHLESILNYYSREELEALCGPFPMAQILDLTATGQSEVFLVTEPAYFEAMGRLYTEENVVLFKDWLIYFLVNFLGSAMDREAYETLSAIEMEAMGISGAPSDLDVELELLETYLPVPMDNLYIQAYCTQEERQEIMDLIDDVIVHYRAMLERETWLSPATREKAVEKLDAMRVHAVFPDELGDWSQADFRSKEEGGTLLEALRTLNQFSIDACVNRVNQSVDPDEWNQEYGATSQVNAYYTNSSNTITILAGILGGVFYQPDMSFEEKLGGIGVVIGHEISHAFDADGANFDANGHVTNWWTPEDYAAFRARAEKLAAYYDGYVPYKGGVYSGNQVQSEAIADMAGMKCALAIAKEREDFDYNVFFRQFAKVWRTKMLPNALIVTVATDSHPLGCLRTNVTVQQFEEFYETYEVGPGDKMYLAPEDRISVW